MVEHQHQERQKHSEKDSMFHVESRASGDSRRARLIAAPVGYRIVTAYVERMTAAEAMYDKREPSGTAMSLHRFLSIA